MKVRFVGDPRYRNKPEKASDPAVLDYHGKKFAKGEWVTVDENGGDKKWADLWAATLRRNTHFEVGAEAKQEPYTAKK